MNNSQLMGLNKYIVESRNRLNGLEDSITQLLHSMYLMREEIDRLDSYVQGLSKLNETNKNREMPELR